MASAAGAGDGGVARGGVITQLESSQNGDALHTQVKLAADFAEGKQKEKTWSKHFLLAAIQTSHQCWKAGFAIISTLGEEMGVQRGKAACPRSHSS